MPYDMPDRLDYVDARYQTAVGGTLAWRLAHSGSHSEGGT